MTYEELEAHERPELVTKRRGRSKLWECRATLGDVSAEGFGLTELEAVANAQQRLALRVSQQ